MNLTNETKIKIFDVIDNILNKKDDEVFLDQIPVFVLLKELKDVDVNNTAYQYLKQKLLEKIQIKGDYYSIGGALQKLNSDILKDALKVVKEDSVKREIFFALVPNDVTDVEFVSDFVENKVGKKIAIGILHTLIKQKSASPENKKFYEYLFTKWLDGQLKQPLYAKMFSYQEWYDKYQEVLKQEDIAVDYIDEYCIFTYEQLFTVLSRYTYDWLVRYLSVQHLKLEYPEKLFKPGGSYTRWNITENKHLTSQQIINLWNMTMSSILRQKLITHPNAPASLKLAYETDPNIIKTLKKIK